MRIGDVPVFGAGGLYGVFAEVVLEHVGFGGRDRELHLYFWDERDGVDFSGWWVTPDFKGNGEYFLTCGTQAATPDKCERGAWRSPNVEQLQLKRSLDLAFAPDAAAGGLVAAGDDAATPIVPDNIVKVNFSKLPPNNGMSHPTPTNSMESVQQNVLSVLVPSRQYAVMWNV